MKKLITSLLVFITMCSLPTNYIYANEDPDIKNEIIETLGLIESGSVGCSTGTKKIHLQLDTIASGTMQTVGFKNIIIERSSNGSNWVEESRINQITATNSNRYYIYDYVVWVNGGYYYRATLDHYAENYSGTEEYYGNTSNYVWVS